MHQRTGSFLSVLFFLMLTFPIYAQQHTTQFGFAVRPGFPSKYFRTGPLTFTDSTITYSLVQESGISYGGLVRHGIDKRFSFESGIIYTKRNYRFSLTDTSFTGGGEFSIVGYEIPFSGIVFIQLGQELWMSAGMGGLIDIFPSDVSTAGAYYLQYSAREQKVNAAVSAQLGCEWRTKKSGAFYLGAYYHRALQSIYTTIVQYYPDRDLANAYASIGRTKMQGDYFGIDFKYYFHEKPEKKSGKKKRK